MDTVSPWQRPFPPEECDVAIVGGGIMGTGTAYSLSRLDPNLRVVLLEADRLAAGASGRNAGFLMPGTHRDPAASVDLYGEDLTKRLWRFTMENVEMVERVAEPAASVRMTGFLLAADDPEEIERLRHSATLIESFGSSCQILDAETVNERLGSTGFHGGLFVAAGGVLNPAALVRQLAEESGATIIERAPVVGLSPTDDGVRVSGNDFHLIADKVVLCLNAYLPRLLPEAADFVRPVRAQMLATAPIERFLEPPLYAHDGYYYLRQRTDGRMFVGGARHLHADEEKGHGDATTEALQHDLEEFLSTHFPRVGRPPIERRWSGTMGFSPDGLPVAGRSRDSDRIIFAAGFTGHGLGYGLRFGQLLARMATGRKDDAFDLFDRARLDDSLIG